MRLEQAAWQDPYWEGASQLLYWRQVEALVAREASSCIYRMSLFVLKKTQSLALARL